MHELDKSFCRVLNAVKIREKDTNARIRQVVLLG